MAIRVWRNPAAVCSPGSLVIRGGLVRTFGGLAIFLVLTFLCAGIYLLGDALLNPLAAQAAALIFGAFSIALATILLFYLLRPERRAPSCHRQQSRHRGLLPKRELLGKIVVMEPRNQHRPDLVYQRVYRDQSRIRL